MWILLVLAYGLIKGFREIFKKKAFKKTSVMEVLIGYTVISFLIVFVMAIPKYDEVIAIKPECMLLTAIKSFVIFVAWILSFRAIKKMPVSLYGVLDLSRVLFTTILGAIFLRETLTSYQIIGLMLVLVGLLMLNMKKESNSKARETKVKYIVMAIISCLLNSVSSTMDKILNHDMKMTSSMLQWWYMLFLVLMYLIYIMINKIKINWKNIITNPWIIALSIFFVFADKMLFIANSDGASKVTQMTLIKQSCCIITILGGKIFFKEKNILYKLLCAGIVISGIVISVMK